MTDSRLSERNRAEMERSATQAASFVLKPLQPAQIDRYLNPPADTPFALEYAYHLLGDIRGKTVLDLGCGTAEKTVPLLGRGARVIGMDISPDLVAIARRRLQAAHLEASLMVGSAYEIGLPDESVDIIFCMGLIHHLDIKLVRDEMWRVLRKGGAIILREPIRFSKGYAWVRSWLPAQKDVSKFEHPLTQEELTTMTQTFRAEETRYFRLPFVPLVARILPSKEGTAWRASGWILKHWKGAERYATGVAMKLQKSG